MYLCSISYDTLKQYLASDSQGWDSRPILQSQAEGNYTREIQESGQYEFYSFCFPFVTASFISA